MSNEDALTPQDGLLASSREKIEMNYLRAVGRGDADPVVLMIDLRDDRARAMLPPSSRYSDLADSMATEAASRDEAPVVFWGLPRREALRVAAGRLSGLEGAFEEMDAGVGYHVVAVGAGGYAVAVMPPPPG